MKSKKMRDAFGYIDDKYLELAESRRVDQVEMDNLPGRRKNFWRYGGLVAACLLCMVLCFSGGVLASDWDGVRSLLLRNRGGGAAESTASTAAGLPGGASIAGILPGDGETPETAALVEGQDPVSEYEKEPSLLEVWDLISLSGYWDSVESRALAEWLVFREKSVSEDGIKDLYNPGEPYDLYGVYNEKCLEKLKEILEKYQLKPHRIMNGVCAKELAYRVGGQFWSDCCKVYSGYIYDDGTFQYDGECKGDVHIDYHYQLRRTVKGVFDEVYLNVGNAGEYEEWSYTTACGERVMLAISPWQSLIYGDFEQCFVAINGLGGYESESPLTKDDLQNFADSFDFRILKKVQKPDMRGDIWE